MTDDFRDRRDNSPATRSFEEWLDQQAEQQGISREELFEQLISSYWTLNEMIQLLDDSGNNTSIADIHPGDASDDGDTGAVPMVGNSRGNGTDDPPRDRRSTRPSDQQDGRGRESRDDRRRESRDDRRRDRSSRDDVDPDRIADLRDRIEQLESELDAEQERGQSLDGLTEVLAGRLTELEEEFERLESESESARESLSAEYDDLADRLDDLETELGGRQKQLASEQERIRSRLNAEFDDLEAILEYLVSQTDELDATVADVEERYDEELAQLKWERDALRSLKRAAADHDVHAGECESCGERVDLDLLTEPYCRECGELLTGIEEKSKWLLFSDIVITTDEESGSDTATSPPTDGTQGRVARSPPQSTATDSVPPAPDRSDRPTRQGATDGRGGTGRAQPQGGEPDSEPSRQPGGRGERAGANSATADRTPDADPSGDPDDSSFEFGGFDSDPGAGAQSTDDDPFGDIDALKRQERGDE